MTSMKIGDKLLEINGEPVKQLTHKEALMIIDLGVLILCTSVYMYVKGPSLACYFQNLHLWCCCFRESNPLRSLVDV